MQIARTLEKVEDMDVESLAAGIPWDFTTFPEYLASVGGRARRSTSPPTSATPPLRIYVMGDEASSRTATPDEVAQMAGPRARGDGCRRRRVRHQLRHHPPRRRRPADPQPLVGPGRARGAVPGRQADSGRGAIGINGVSDELHFDQIYDLQRELGVPVTWTALLTTLDRHATSRRWPCTARAWQKGSAVFPQVSPRPLTFSMNMVEPFTLNTSPVFAELMAGTLEGRARAYADPAWRQRVRDAWAVRAQGRAAAALGDLRADGVERPTPSSSAAASSSSPPSAAPTRSTLLLDLAVAEPTLQDIRVKAVLANDDEDGVRTLLQEDGCTLGLSDAGAHVSQLCDAPLATDLLGQLGARQGRADASSRPCTS